jgi:hypothetical protein
VGKAEIWELKGGAFNRSESYLGLHFWQVSDHAIAESGVVHMVISVNDIF